MTKNVFASPCFQSENRSDAKHRLRPIAALRVAALESARTTAFFGRKIEQDMIQQLPREETYSFRDLVRRTLAHNPCFAGHHLRVDFEQRDVILRGEVQSWYQKQIAQESVRKIAGIGTIRNELKVVGTCS